VGIIDRGHAQGPVWHLFVTVDPELHRQVRRPIMKTSCWSGVPRVLTSVAQSIT
jgi:hypothetical protein